MSRRIPVPNGIRKEMFAAEPYTDCYWCGDQATEIDHIVPYSRGGTNERSNLKPVCFLCNREKMDMTVEEWKATRIYKGWVWYESPYKENCGFGPIPGNWSFSKVDVAAITLIRDKYAGAIPRHDFIDNISDVDVRVHYLNIYFDAYWYGDNYSCERRRLRRIWKADPETQRSIDVDAESLLSAWKQDRMVPDAKVQLDLESGLLQEITGLFPPFGTDNNVNNFLV